MILNERHNVSFKIFCHSIPKVLLLKGFTMNMSNGKCKHTNSILKATSLRE